jgi:hypothetical protein
MFMTNEVESKVFKVYLECDPSHVWKILTNILTVIPAIQEAEIRRIIVQSQPQANSLQDPISKIPITKTKTKKGWQSGSKCRP